MSVLFGARFSRVKEKRDFPSVSYKIILWRKNHGGLKAYKTFEVFIEYVCVFLMITSIIKLLIFFSHELSFVPKYILNYIFIQKTINYYFALQLNSKAKDNQEAYHAVTSEMRKTLAIFSKWNFQVEVETEKLCISSTIKLKYRLHFTT